MSQEDRAVGGGERFCGEDDGSDGQIRSELTGSQQVITEEPEEEKGRAAGSAVEEEDAGVSFKKRA